MNERSRGLQDTLVASSCLQEEIAEARGHIGMLRAIASSLSARRNRRFQIAIETLLFFIATLQAIPLVIEIPVSGVLRIVISSALGSFVGLFLLMRIMYRG